MGLGIICSLSYFHKKLFGYVSCVSMKNGSMCHLKFLMPSKTKKVSSANNLQLFSLFIIFLMNRFVCKMAENSKKSNIIIISTM